MTVAQNDPEFQEFSKMYSFFKEMKLQEGCVTFLLSCHTGLISAQIWADLLYAETAIPHLDDQLLFNRQGSSIAPYSDPQLVSGLQWVCANASGTIPVVKNLGAKSHAPMQISYVRACRVHFH